MPRSSSIDPTTRYLQWSSDVPLTRVDGVLADGDDRITVLRHLHRSRLLHAAFRRVTLDRTTGEVLEVIRSESETGA